MAITSNATTLTFNNGSTQTVAPVNTNANVNSVSAGTGISVSATTGALTVTNSGVTSVAAGTGISVSASTGGVTISNTLPGGVSSLNGQTGAITNTNLEAIGSYIIAANGITASGSGTLLDVNSTIAGSSLRYNVGGGSFVESNNPFMGNVSVGYPLGGNSLSGTWRAMSRCYVTRSYDPCEGVGLALWYSGLWVRIS